MDLSPDAAALLTATARPIVLARARATLPGVAPDNRDPGIMLPYTPLHHLLFAARAPSRRRRHRSRCTPPSTRSSSRAA
ncbi:MAG TPA: hypothetical protein VKD69_18445 [Vicinamibacterales bacterium]|nr:hypothetical protein [Vicinamibacterales bacterium]